MSLSKISKLGRLIFSPSSCTAIACIAFLAAPGFAAISLTSSTPASDFEIIEDLACCCTPCCCTPCCCTPCCPTDDAPVIEWFAAVYDEETDQWIFAGEVDDEDPDNCTVTFGGILDGHSCDVDQEGNFEYILDLDEEGLVSVEAIDDGGQESEVEYDDVDTYCA